jgi:hypothetical protein
MTDAAGYYAKSEEAVAEEFSTSLKEGLSQETAAGRLKEGSSGYPMDIDSISHNRKELKSCNS